MRFFFTVIGFVIVLGGLYIIYEAHSQLSDIERTVRTASDIPVVGWFTGSLADYEYAEAKDQLELTRFIGIGIACFGALLFLFALLLRGKKDEPDKTPISVSVQPQEQPREAMRVCLKCGFQNSPNVRFCGDCGAELVTSMKRTEDAEKENEGEEREGAL